MNKQYFLYFITQWFSWEAISANHRHCSLMRTNNAATGIINMNNSIMYFKKKKEVILLLENILFYVNELAEKMLIGVVSEYEYLHVV